jgi:hypothetical protein
MISWRLVLRSSIRSASRTVRFSDRADLRIARLLYLTGAKIG